MANFQPAALIEYDGRLLNGTDLLYDTTQGVRIWGNATQDNYSIGDTTTGGVDSTYGSNNLAFGAYALNAIQGASSSKTYNIAIGSSALKTLSAAASTTSTENIAIGKDAAILLSKGSGNIFIGRSVVSSYSSASQLLYNTIIGNNILKNTTTIGSSNTLLGTNILSGTVGLTIGSSNVFMGASIGSSSLTSVSGSNSVFIGTNILQSSTRLPSQCIYIGYSAGINFTVGGGDIGYNVCIGNLAGASSSANTTGATLVGDNAQGGAQCTVIGYSSGYGSMSGISNTILGDQSGNFITTGEYNILLGSSLGGNLTTGSQNILIGSLFNAQSPTGSNNIDILTNTGTTGLQYTNSTGTLKLLSSLVNVPSGRFLINGVTSDDNIPMQVSPTVTTTTTANIFTYYHTPSINPTAANLNGNAIGINVNPKYISNFIPNAASSHYSGMQITTGATSALTTAIPDVRGMTISFSAGLYAATVAPVEYTHLRLTDPSLNGSTNTYNIYSGSNTATGKWNLYLTGTASNYVASKILLGSTTDAGTGEILQVTGTALVTSNFKVSGAQINTAAQANTGWLGTGTANSTTFLRGDGTWATPGSTTTTTSIARTFALMGA